MGPLVWLIMGYSLVIIREWNPDYCCVPKAHFSLPMLGYLCPSCGLGGFPWVGPLVGLLPDELKGHLFSVHFSD